VLNVVKNRSSASMPGLALQTQNASSRYYK